MTINISLKQLNVFHSITQRISEDTHTWKDVHRNGSLRRILELFQIRFYPLCHPCIEKGEDEFKFGTRANLEKNGAIYYPWRFQCIKETPAHRQSRGPLKFAVQAWVVPSPLASLRVPMNSTKRKNDSSFWRKFDLLGVRYYPCRYPCMYKS